MTMMYVGVGLTVASAAYQQDQQKQNILDQTVQGNLQRSGVNLANAVRAGYRKGLLNVQEGQYKKAAAQQGFDTSAMQSEALGATSANAAAAGSVGASVDAVAQDIQMRLGELRARREEDQAIAGVNFDLQGEEIAFGLEQGRLPSIEANVPSNGAIFANAALAGGAYFASTYGAAKMRLDQAPTRTTSEPLWTRDMAGPRS